jgi:hypothetical protein
MKIGETLRNEYPLHPPMPEFLAALLADLERSEHYLVRGWDPLRCAGLGSSLSRKVAFGPLIDWTK